MVARNPDGWGYQLYLAREEANEEIGRNVRCPLRAHCNPSADDPFPQIPLFYKIVYQAATPTEQFSLVQNIRDIITGKAEYNPDEARPLLSDQVSLYLCPYSTFRT